jgi:hypothetical protein
LEAAKAMAVARIVVRRRLIAMFKFFMRREVKTVQSAVQDEGCPA